MAQDWGCKYCARLMFKIFPISKILGKIYFPNFTDDICSKSSESWPRVCSKRSESCARFMERELRWVWPSKPCGNYFIGGKLMLQHTSSLQRLKKTIFMSWVFIQMSSRSFKAIRTYNGYRLNGTKNCELATFVRTTGSYVCNIMWP